MKILIDLQHPAHLHVFRPAIAKWEELGHQVLITGRDKDILVQLADKYNIPMTVFGKAKKGFFNLARELFYRQWLLNKIIRRFKPDVMLAVAGTFISLLGKLRRIPVYIFYDTEHATLSNLLAYPFSTCIYVPCCYRKHIRWNHVRYNGYHEIAYLHPDYFQPDPGVLKEIGVQPDQRYTLVRFVGWGAGHDIGLTGLSLENKIMAIRELEAFGPVFISSEGPLPPRLESYRLRIDITRIHSVIAYAALTFGESATMASEGAVLGVPGVYVDPAGRGYTDEQQEQYKIVFHYTHQQQDQAIRRAVDILSGYPHGREKWKSTGRQIIADKIDVTQLITNVALDPNYTLPE